MGFFSKNKSKVQGAATPPANPLPSSSSGPTHERAVPARPQVLLIDTHKDCGRLLAAARFNVAEGTFGSSYSVQRSGHVLPISSEARLGPHAEKDIIVVDLDVGPITLPRDYSDGPVDVEHYWASCETGRLDTRPLGMLFVSDTLDRIVANGGVVIVFARPKLGTKYVRGIKRPYGVERVKDHSLDDWAFLSVLAAVETTVDHGQEMNVAPSEGALGTLLRRHFDDSSFSCALSPECYGPYIPRIKDEWRPLATNRYGNTVAAAIMPDSSRSGLVLIFPEIKRKPEFLRDLLSDVLPELMPSLFPDQGGGKWIHQQEYESPAIVRIRDKIESIIADANKQVEICNSAIEVEQANYGFMYDLLRETGQPLVLAVKAALEKLGFSSVVDADSESIKRGKKSDLAEDLWIVEPGRPLVLVEVKGLTRLAPDAESLQAWKYLAPRMKELQRLDIRALSIINHQRNLPPLDRNNDNVFRKEVITNAEEHDFGLMTTWDLFRLIRNTERNGWAPGLVKPMFYERGRLSSIPVTYSLVGTVERVLEKAGVISVRIEASELSQGDRIAFARSVDIYEQNIESMQVEKTPRDRATKGELVGIKTSFSGREVRVDTPVFLCASNVQGQDEDSAQPEIATDGTARRR